jgi:hypothetical protein
MDRWDLIRMDFSVISNISIFAVHGFTAAIGQPYCVGRWVPNSLPRWRAQIDMVVCLKRKHWDLTGRWIRFIEWLLPNIKDIQSN